MQATQSKCAMGSEFVSGAFDSGKFAALRHVTREMSLHNLAVSAVRRTSAAPGGAVAVADVAEGPGLAHDAGNLLGALSLYSDLLAMPGVLHEEHREYASELRMLSDRSWAMIDRLVNHTRAGCSRKRSSETAVLPDVLDRCKGLLSRVAGRTVEISYGVGAFQPVPVPVESVERVLTNLVKNAAEATPWVGAISIHVEGVIEGAGQHQEARELCRRVVMTVRDRGCGMDSAGVKRLMQDDGTSKSNGRGLGFRVVRELVAISGGCLKIESQPEVGTSVSAEWYALSAEEAEIRCRRGSERDLGVNTVLRAEAGWIAC